MDCILCKDMAFRSTINSVIVINVCVHANWIVCGLLLLELGWLTFVISALRKLKQKEVRYLNVHR